MLGTVAGRILFLHRFALLGWCLGLLSYVALIASFYPSIRDNTALLEAMKAYPEQMRAFVFITGGAFTPRATHFLDRVANLRLDKPCAAHELREAVRVILRSTDAPESRRAMRPG